MDAQLEIYLKNIEELLGHINDRITSIDVELLDMKARLVVAELLSAPATKSQDTTNIKQLSLYPSVKNRKRMAGYHHQRWTEFMEAFIWNQWRDEHRKFTEIAETTNNVFKNNIKWPMTAIAVKKRLYDIKENKRRAIWEGEKRRMIGGTETIDKEA